MVAIVVVLVIVVVIVSCCCHLIHSGLIIVPVEMKPTLDAVNDAQPGDKHALLELQYWIISGMIR